MRMMSLWKAMKQCQRAMGQGKADPFFLNGPKPVRSNEYYVLELLGVGLPRAVQELTALARTKSRRMVFLSETRHSEKCAASSVVFVSCGALSPQPKFASFHINLVAIS